MEASDDEDAKLKEEIEAELDKISISSLEEEEETESDTVSETLSYDSDISEDELSDSVIHCINTIKNSSKTVEELILQDLEDTDVLSSNYGAVSNNHMHLRMELLTTCKENPEQLLKVLSGIEKEELMRSASSCAGPASPQDLGSLDLSMDDYGSDDIDINFGYFEVEERCRQSFEAWQDEQKELEDREQKTLKAQREREEKEFQEEDEKRECRMKRFEVEKKMLEELQKQEEDKMSEELRKEEEMWKEELRRHEEFLRNLHLQMEEERTRLKDLEKEEMHLLECQHNAAIKIQAQYKAFVTYQKYAPIIRERIEIKKRKEQEWKEREAKIRQMVEERQKSLEEVQMIEKKNQEERKKREREYEEKKNILRQERVELLNKDKLKLRKNITQWLTMSSALKKGDYNAKHVTRNDISKKRNDSVKISIDENLKKQDVSLGLFEESNKKQDIERQLVLKESTQAQLTSNQTILAEIKMEQKSESLGKKQTSENSVSQETRDENINKNTKLEIMDQMLLVELKTEEKSTSLENKESSEKSVEQDIKDANLDKKVKFKNSNMKENVNEQKLKPPMPTEESVDCAIHENVREKIQIILDHNQETTEIRNEAQKIINDNQPTVVQSIENDTLEQNGSLNQENSASVIAKKQKVLSIKLENFETVLRENVIDSKYKETEENALSGDKVIFDTSVAIVNTEGKIDKQDVFGRPAPCEDVDGYDAGRSLVTKEVNCPNCDPETIPEECWENRARHRSIRACSIPESTLLSSIEEKRLAWIKSFKPWFEIHEQNQQKKVVQRKRLVKNPSNSMPPLDALEILGCGSWKNLQQVTTITFQDLPGCSLSTLAECVNLQFLSLRRCGLTSLHGLSNCKSLRYIDTQENHIESINCEQLENLSVVLLNKNQLTSLHGLDGCTNIQNLELSHNKITRLGGLESLKNLQQLIVDHNQLISTKGLCDTPTIIYLDCSYNNLTDVEGIENCGLLQVLKLQGNYLSKLPYLGNHVLLRELHLDDNSISTLEAFSSYWLPLLQNLSISQNSLTKIVPLFHFISLEKLDVSNNCLSDLKNVLKWFQGCCSLHEVSLIGNPLLQEVNWRHSLVKILPALRIINGDALSSHSESSTEEHRPPESGQFLVLCQTQMRELKVLAENCTATKGDVFTLDTAENIHHYFKKLMTRSHEYRCAHERGDVSVTELSETSAQQNHRAPPRLSGALQHEASRASARVPHGPSPRVTEQSMDSGFSRSPLSCSPVYQDLEERNQQNFVCQQKLDTKTTPTRRNPSVETTAGPLLRRHQNTEHSKKITAAVVIQAHWRAYVVRRQIQCSSSIHTVTMESLPNSFSNQTVLMKEKRKSIMNIHAQMEKAAILIQAVWKGFILRKKLTIALEAIKNEESEEEYEEIDLNYFAFDEAALEREWLAVDPTRFPSQTLPLSAQQYRPKTPRTLKYDGASLNLPNPPAQAWLCNERENLFSSEQTQLNSSSENRMSPWAPESKTRRKSLLKSEKEEKISEEWGFKDISTAQLMLKRAQKMKSKKSKKNLDPTVRLGLFKNSENKVSVTKSPQKAHFRRNSHSEDKEEDLLYKDSSANEKLERSRAYTYQWLHTQVGIPEATHSRNMKSNHFLPELDPEILNGGRVQLVARLVSREDTDLDLFSMTSGSDLSVNREKKSQAHRHSAGSSSCSIKGTLAPMITNTRPKKERVSFRDNPLQLSGGWGSGKRKAKRSTYSCKLQHSKHMAHC